MSEIEQTREKTTANDDDDDIELRLIIPFC